VKVLLGAYHPARHPVAKLRRIYTFARNACPAELKLDRAIVSFTFDDFPRSCVENAAPILEAAGVRATFYACAGFEGRKNHFGELFTHEDIKRLRAAGHEIGCHTFGHIDCSRERTQTSIEQCEANANALRAALEGEAMTSFAYPYGETKPAFKRHVAERYLTARGIRGGVNHGRIDLSHLRSEALYGPDTYARANERIGQAVRTKGWLTFFTHDVCDTPSAWGTDTTIFQRVVEAAKAADVDILPMRDAARRVLR
jgi:peptidoglycan/xylan/chitin deacetylase (PgdA/CDA1 family)